MNEILAGYIDKSFELRHSVPKVSFNDSVEVLESARFSIRQNIDQLEEHLNGATRFKGEAERSLADAKAIYEHDWDAACREDKPKMAFGSDMIAPRERYAAASLKVMKQKVDLDRAEEVLSFAKETLEVIKNMHKGLDGYRLEVLSMIKSRSVPTAAEYHLRS